MKSPFLAIGQHELESILYFTVVILLLWRFLWPLSFNSPIFDLFNFDLLISWHWLSANTLFFSLLDIDFSFLSWHELNCHFTLNNDLSCLPWHWTFPFTLSVTFDLWLLTLTLILSRYPDIDLGILQYLDLHFVVFTYIIYSLSLWHWTFLLS